MKIAEIQENDFYTKLQSKADNNQLELHQLMSLFRSYFDRYLVLEQYSYGLKPIIFSNRLYN